MENLEDFLIPALISLIILIFWIKSMIDISTIKKQMRLIIPSKSQVLFHAEMKEFEGDNVEAVRLYKSYCYYVFTYPELSNVDKLKSINESANKIVALGGTVPKPIIDAIETLSAKKKDFRNQMIAR